MMLGARPDDTLQTPNRPWCANQPDLESTSSPHLAIQHDQIDPVVVETIRVEAIRKAGEIARRRNGILSRGRP
jgi:hypothetical protein